MSYNITLRRMCTRMRLREFPAWTSRTTIIPVHFFRRPTTPLRGSRRACFTEDRSYAFGTRNSKTRCISDMMVSTAYLHIFVMMFLFTSSCAKIRTNDYNKRERSPVSSQVQLRCRHYALICGKILSKPIRLGVRLYNWSDRYLQDWQRCRIAFLLLEYVKVWVFSKVDDRWRLRPHPLLFTIRWPPTTYSSDHRQHSFSSVQSLSVLLFSPWSLHPVVSSLSSIANLVQLLSTTDDACKPVSP